MGQCRRHSRRQGKKQADGGPTATSSCRRRWSASMPVAVEQQDTPANRRPQRSGLRETGHAMRSAPLMEDTGPQHQAIEGGSYGPLRGDDCERIHEGVLTLLETVGFANAIPSCIKVLA